MSNKFRQLEVTPRALSSVPSGSEGQLAVVNDQTGLPIWARDSNGNLVEAVQPYGARVLGTTKEALQFYVDTTSGTSPPAGTVIREQAEYTALGYDFKYPDDVFDVLPDNLAHPVIITFRDGTHNPRTNNLGVPGYEVLLAIPGRLQAVSGQVNFATAPYYYPGLYFESENQNELEALQAGTLSNRTITRSSGTWTTDQYKGKFVLINTGPGAGSLYPITSNTTTALSIPYGTSSGAVTFSIVEPGAKLVSTASSYRGLLFSDTALNGYNLSINNLTLGSSTYPLDSTTTHNAVWLFEECEMFWKLLYNASIGSIGWLSFRQCVVDLAGQSGFGFAALSAGGVFTLNTYFRGRYSSAGTSLIEVNDSAVASFNGSFADVNATFGGGAVMILDGGRVYEANTMRLEGNGSCTGIHALGGHLEEVPRISNCTLGMDVEYGRTTCRSAPPAADTTNVDGISVSNGATLVVPTPGNITASGNELTVDGTTYAYTDLASGNFIEGSGGSRIVRT